MNWDRDRIIRGRKKKQKNKAFKKLVLEYVWRKTKPQEYGKEYRKNQYENMPE